MDWSFRGVNRKETKKRLLDSVRWYVWGSEWKTGVCFDL